MRRILIAVALSAAAVTLHARSAHAQTGTADLEVCVAIDEARDGLSAQDRVSALLVLERQFELAGWRIAGEGCTNQYVLSHIPLGDHIIVRLAGPSESREGIAAGLSDLQALYDQMVRSIVTGRPMTGFNVIDRTNVTAAQSRANRVHSDRYAYGRLGFGAIVGERVHGTPALGVGYRAELDAFGIDVSFFNVQTSGGSYVDADGASMVALVRLQALYFLKPTANASAYVGGGLSWGATNITAAPDDDRRDSYTSFWQGNGMQGELTVGYELPRASTLRVFVEGTATLPFYRVASERYPLQPNGSRPDISRRYAPAFVASIGFGWQPHRDGLARRPSRRAPRRYPARLSTRGFDTAAAGAITSR
jgi:hypothetical protein